MSEEKYSSRVTSPTGSETSEAAAGRKYIFIRSGVRTSELLDTARFPPQYQYTVTGRVRKRGSHGQIGKLVQLNGYNIAIFRHAKLLYAINDKCSHLGARRRRRRRRRPAALASRQLARLLTHRHRIACRAPAPPSAMDASKCRRLAVARTSCR